MAILDGQVVHRDLGILSNVETTAISLHRRIKADGESISIDDQAFHATYVNGMIDSTYRRERDVPGQIDGGVVGDG